MESAFAWLGQIFNWLGQWIPRWEILDLTQGAVKFKGGKTAVYCEPGIHFWWPARSKFAMHPIARQTDQLEAQVMESSDGVTFLVGGTLTYSIPDLLALVTTTHSAFHAIQDMAQAAVHDVLCDLTWVDLQAQQRKGTIKTKLRNAAQDQLKTYGVRVEKLQLNSLARCRVYKVSQSTCVEGS